MSNLRNNLDEQALRVKAAIHSLKQGVRIDVGDGKMLNILPDVWSEIPATNVHLRIGSLNVETPGLTVAFAKFKTGGHIQAHSHDRIETVFVLDGEYEDPIRGIKLGPGDVDHIEPGIVHSQRSDHALLAVTWRPAYDTFEVE